MANITNIFTSQFDSAQGGDSVFPQAVYLFKVTFDGADTGDVSDALVDINNNDKVVSITATLPKSQTKTVTQWYKGTPKTRIVNVDRSGETTLTFIMRRTGLGDLTTLFNIDGYDLEGDSTFYHDEFNKTFNKIYIYTLKSNNENPANLISNRNTSCKFTLYNCVVTGIDFGDLSYDSTEYVKVTVNVHYDYWSCE